MIVKEEQLNQEVETEWIAHVQCIYSDPSFLDQFLLYVEINRQKSGNTQSLKSITSKFPDIPVFSSKYVE